MRRSLNLCLAAIISLTVCWSTNLRGQSSSSENVPETVPETAYISQSKYTNVFFGFSLTLPNGASFHQLTGNTQGFLFGVQALREKNSFGFSDSIPALSMMVIVYKKPGAELTAAEAQEFVAGTVKPKPMRILIGGKDFWESQSEENTKLGKMRILRYAVPLGEYDLEIAISSFDGKLTAQLQHSIESINFFEPSHAAEIAGAGSRLYDPSGRHMAKLKAGVVRANTYTNDDLGFAYRFPPEWSVADEVTIEKILNAGHQAVYGDDPAAAREHAMYQKCARFLLMVNRYPAGTDADGVNPMVAITAIDPVCFPSDVSFPSSLNDRERVTQLAKAFLALMGDAPIFGKGQNSVRAASGAGNRVWINLFSTANVGIVPGKPPVTVFTAFALTEVRDYWVAWMFVAGSQVELDQLEHTEISFNPRTP